METEAAGQDYPTIWTKAQIKQMVREVLVETGQITLNQYRVSRGLTPYAMPEADELYVTTPDGLVKQS